MRIYPPNLDKRDRYTLQISPLANVSCPIPAWTSATTPAEIHEIGQLKRFCSQQRQHRRRRRRTKTNLSRNQSVHPLNAIWRIGALLCLSVHLASYSSNASESTIPPQLIPSDLLSVHSETRQDFIPLAETKPSERTESNVALNAVNLHIQEEVIPEIEEPIITETPTVEEPTEELTEERAFGFTNPVVGFPITSKFGSRVHPITGDVRFHQGIDIGTPTGTPIRTAGAGTVVFAGWSDGYGKKIVIDHGKGYETLYAHLDQLFVKVGDRLSDGAIVGLSGSTGHVTGPHLHFEIQLNAVARDPLNYF
ncbi:M23 family metallopeptidase [Egbenema bharatensis]|uniref:M23 family metallopeptidase n=1 Tax=Egbenema bharatensis TaxID=3463334 RepID=UPI003A8C55E5